MRKADVTPVGIAMTKDGKTAYVTLGRAAHVAIVDVAARKVLGYVLVGKRAWGLTLSRDEKTLYVANGSAMTCPLSTPQAARRKFRCRSVGFPIVQ
jgi:DNA-binding beta-propeller fold protein YncE